jgi:hypothetical protein
MEPGSRFPMMLEANDPGIILLSTALRCSILRRAAKRSSQNPQAAGDFQILFKSLDPTLDLHRRDRCRLAANILNPADFLKKIISETPPDGWGVGHKRAAGGSEVLNRGWRRDYPSAGRDMSKTFDVGQEGGGGGGGGPGGGGASGGDAPPSNSLLAGDTMLQAAMR